MTTIGLLGKLLRDRRGATAVEYGFILALVVLALMAALIAFAGSTVDMWGAIAAKVIAAGR